MKKHNVFYTFKFNTAIISIVVFSLLTMLVMGYIFYNSCQSKEVSTDKSDKVVEQVKPVVDPQDKIDDEEFTKTTRKIAHGIEFCALGICLCGLMFSVSAITKKKHISMTLLIALLTAVTDEFIQSFNDRSSEVKDVLIDFGGAVIGVLIVFLIVFAYNRIKKKEQS